MTLEYSRQILQKSYWRFMKMRLVGAKLFHAEDRQTWRS